MAISFTFPTHNNSRCNMDTDTVAYIGAATAVGALLGIFANMWATRRQIESSTQIAKLQIAASAKIAKKQIQAQVESLERMKWIAKLRDSIAAFVGCVIDLARYKDIQTTMDPPFSERQHDTLSKAAALEHQIKLLLNPTEQDHITLAKLITKSIMTIVHDQQTDGHIIKDIRETSQGILKREWEVVKRMEESSTSESLAADT